MKWRTVQLTWHREDGNLSEIAAWPLRFGRSVELISSHYLLEKNFNQKVREQNMTFYAFLCVCTGVRVSPCVEADNRGRNSAKLLDHAGDKQVFHCGDHEKQLLQECSGLAFVCQKMIFSRIIKKLDNYLRVNRIKGSLDIRKYSWRHVSVTIHSVTAVKKLGKEIPEEWRMEVAFAWAVNLTEDPSHSAEKQSGKIKLLHFPFWKVLFLAFRKCLWKPSGKHTAKTLNWATADIWWTSLLNFHQVGSRY